MPSLVAKGRVVDVGFRVVVVVVVAGVVVVVVVVATPVPRQSLQPKA